MHKDEIQYIVFDICKAHIPKLKTILQKMLVNDSA